MLSKRNGNSEQKGGILLASFAACEPWVASPSILRRQQDCIAAPCGIIQQQRKITEASKKLEMKKLHQALGHRHFANTLQLHKPHVALDTLFRGRHMQISTWVSLQKLRLISAARAGQHDFLLLEAAQPARAGRRHQGAERPAAEEQLYRLYEQATREPCSFLFVYT